MCRAAIILCFFGYIMSSGHSSLYHFRLFYTSQSTMLVSSKVHMGLLLCCTSWIHHVTRKIFSVLLLARLIRQELWYIFYMPSIMDALCDLEAIQRSRRALPSLVWKEMSLLPRRACQMHYVFRKPSSVLLSNVKNHGTISRCYE